MSEIPPPRPVWQDDGVTMREEWFSTLEAARVLAKLRGRDEAFHPSWLTQLVKKGRLRRYNTPLGGFFHLDDLIAYHQEFPDGRTTKARKRRPPAVSFPKEPAP